MHRRIFFGQQYQYQYAYFAKMQTDERLFRVLNRKLYCWIDKWHGMTMQDIRDMEDRAAKELAEVRVGVGTRKPRPVDSCTWLLATTSGWPK